MIARRLQCREKYEKCRIVRKFSLSSIIASYLIVTFGFALLMRQWHEVNIDANRTHTVKMPEEHDCQSLTWNVCSFTNIFICCFEWDEFRLRSMSSTLSLMWRCCTDEHYHVPKREEWDDSILSSFVLYYCVFSWKRRKVHFSLFSFSL
jgi:hypothetical protein